MEEAASDQDQEMASSVELAPGVAESAAGLEMSDRGLGWADQ